MIHSTTKRSLLVIFFEKIRKHWKTICAIVIVPLTWLVFPFLTYGSKSTLHLLPLVLLLVQINLMILFRRKKLLLLVLLNPVAVFAIYYTIKPMVKHALKEPTIIKCCYYRPGGSSFDKNRSVFLDYYDDDCDWEGLYHYTLDINNFVTNELIDLFGNPTRKNKSENNASLQTK